MKAQRRIITVIAAFYLSFSINSFSENEVCGFDEKANHDHSIHENLERIREEIQINFPQPPIEEVHLPAETPDESIPKLVEIHRLPMAG